MTTRRKHVPHRTCVVCRTVQAKRALTRLVWSPEEGLVIDPTGKRSGRGAYLCANPACWAKAARSDVLDKALRRTLTEADRAVVAAHGAQLAPITDQT